MWTKCSVVLDEPDMVGPFELIDAVALIGVFAVVGFFFDMLIGGAFVGAAALGLYRMKRGKPYGTLLHRAHNLELMRLPGFLSPRRIAYSHE